ncbi:MAG: hypothetical protein RL033_8015, partial [Pseudomonadota bacterium]
IFGIQSADNQRTFSLIGAPDPLHSSALPNQAIVIHPSVAAR